MSATSSIMLHSALEVIQRSNLKDLVHYVDGLANKSKQREWELDRV